MKMIALALLAVCGFQAAASATLKLDPNKLECQTHPHPDEFYKVKSTALLYDGQMIYRGGWVNKQLNQAVDMLRCQSIVNHARQESKNLEIDLDQLAGANKAADYYSFYDFDPYWRDDSFLFLEGSLPKAECPK